MNTEKSILTLQILIMIGITLAMTGCSLYSARTKSGAWSCDAQADSAVHEENWQLAQRLHRQFLASNPDNCLAIYHLGYIFGKLEDRNREVMEYERAEACGYNQDDKLYFNMGMAYSELADPERAIGALERAVQIKPRDAENHFGLGYIAKLSNQDALAERALLKAIQLSARHIEARIFLARIYLDQGRLAEAKEQLTVLQEIDPDNEDTRHLWKIYLDRTMTSYEK